MKLLSALKAAFVRLRHLRLFDAIALSFIVAVAALVLLGSLIGSVRWRDLLVIMHPTVSAALAAIVCALMAVPVVLGIVALLRRRWRLGTFGVLAPIVTLPVWGFALLMALGMQWSIISTTTAPSGQTYCFLYMGMLQGQEMALARNVVDLRACRIVRVLGENNADWPTSWAWMIRPEGAPDGSGTLFITGSGMIVGVGTNDRAYLAYDPASNRFYGRGDIESLSPFLLIGPAAEMRHEDVEALLQFEKERKDSADGPGVVREAALLDALKHRNPGVMQLARSILDMRAARPSVESTAD